MENMVTVNDLMDAASLSESDFLIINQMTVEGRSTRKITLQQVSDWAKTHNHIVGEGRIIFRDIDEWDLAENRLLKASYQLIEIADYPELCEVMYCGDNKNNTAPWWYKCDHQGNRTITGLCMRVCSPEGLFPRIAGVNKVYGTAGLLADNIPGNTPYDGKDVGSFNADRDKTYSGGISLKGSIGPETLIYSDGIFAHHNDGPAMYGNPATGTLVPTSSIKIRFGNSYEVAGTWLAARFCISY